MRYILTRDDLQGTYDETKQFESLEELKAFVSQYEEPVDEVLSDWRLQEPAPSWSECSLDGVQTRTETWVRDIIVAGQYGGVTGGELTKTVVATQTCTYVPPPIPSVPPVTWPATWQEMERIPRPGYLIGSGYPYAGRFIDGQGHRADHGDLNAHDGVTHTHNGVMLPLVWHGEILLPIRLVTLHMGGATFDSIRKCMVRGATGITKLMEAPTRFGPGQYKIVIPETTHLWQMNMAVMFDTRTATVPDGWYLFEMDLGFAFPGDKTPGTPGRGSTEFTRVQARVYLNNHDTFRDSMLVVDPANPRPSSIFSAAAEWAFRRNIIDPVTNTKVGEDNTFGYLRAELSNVRMFKNNPNLNMVAVPNGQDQTNPTTELVCINPDLHASTPTFGRVLLPEQPPIFDTGIRTYLNRIPAPEPPINVGDRQFLRVSDVRPGIGAAASIISVTMGEG